jgi:hypothetical protein
MTDEQKSRFAALQGAWLAVREKRRRAEMAAELDAAIMEFLKLHRAENEGRRARIAANIAKLPVIRPSVVFTASQRRFCFPKVLATAQDLRSACRAA